MENNEDGEIPKLNELLTTEPIKNSNNISKITDKIYLGDEEGAKDLEFFKNEQIHHVLSIIPTPPTFPEDMNIELKNLDMDQCPTINIIFYIKECAQFIDKADKIYIHCECGVNRSPAILIGYLMWKTHSSYDDVFEFVKKRRDCIELNNLFIIQLNKFQKLLKNNDYNLNNIEIKKKSK
jgi:hypothetical protein